MSQSFMQGFWMFFHLAGFGIVFALMLFGPMIEKQFQASTDWSARGKLGKLGMRMGMLGSLAFAVLLVSGIGNMVEYGFSMADAFSGVAWWLGAKIILFLLMAANGFAMTAMMRKTRGGVFQQVMAGNVPPDADAVLQGTYARANMFFRVQGFMLLVVVILAVFRP